MDIELLEEFSRTTLISYMQKRQDKLGPRGGRRDGRTMMAALRRFQGPDKVKVPYKAK
ncbi:MAG: hypothetical protein OXI64_03915 [Defluviicoccus sp.]|nr:hypothetical protein [Defluviicoccus sp.]